MCTERSACILLWRGSTKLTHVWTIVFLFYTASWETQLPVPWSRIAQQDYFIINLLPSNPGEYRLGIVLLSKKQAEEGGHGVLNHLVPRRFVLWKWGSSSVFSWMFSWFDLFKEQFSSNESVIRKLSLRFRIARGFSHNKFKKMSNDCL